MAKLEIAILAGDESKKFLAELTRQLDRLDAVSIRIEKSLLEIGAEGTEIEEDAPKKAPKKNTTKVVEEEVEEDKFEEATLEEDDSDFKETIVEEPEEDEVPVTPPKKQKKLTVDDCNDAAKALAKVKGRDEVLSLMQKHFKTKSVSELKPEMYGKFCEKMRENMQ